MISLVVAAYFAFMALIASYFKDSKRYKMSTVFCLINLVVYGITLLGDF